MIMSDLTMRAAVQCYSLLTILAITNCGIIKKDNHVLREEQVFC
jgi:hypothetical protein